MSTDRAAEGWARCGRVLLVSLLGYSLAAGAAVEFTPRVVVGGTYTDNINLQPDDTAEDEFVTEVSPGFSLARDGQRFQANLDYELQSYFFSRVSDRNQSFHRGEGAFSSELLRNFFYLDGGGSYSQSLIDPSEGINFSNLFQTGNRTDVAEYYANPYIARQLGRWAETRVSYNYGFVDYKGTSASGDPLEELERTRTEAELRSPGMNPGRFSWNLRYLRDDSQFEFSQDFRQETAEAGVGYQVTRTLQLTARGGRESDVTRSISDGGLDADFWMLGFNFVPSERQQLSVAFGERYFGNTFDFDYRLSGRIITIGLEYSETTDTVGGRQLGARAINLEPQDVGPGLTPVTAEIFQSDLARGWVRLDGRRNTITLTLYNDYRDYLTSMESESERGVEFDWIYTLGARTRLLLGLQWERFGFRTSDRDDEFSTARFSIERDLSRRISARFLLRHAEQHTDFGAVSPLYEENAAQLVFTATF